ncbi:hypothetical protein [Clostridium beijerinckii]|uniref:BIG2 domain-containing protein n=1 Tax=Clostridium beijerinckii TaxID=1520 RepID=A0AAX0B357_CLOBE|nr:hypothetical protein [Clostridium beijerinckii]NRT88869.1 hypothetical protein [Clostridium beijerinckii]NYC74324.1 hypothetical protein [Clostridium beijerinckii]
MNNSITLDSSYKKAIEMCGVTATINNTDTKILIKEASDEYGIDYKKIISSTLFNQGNYVFVNSVQFLVVDVEEQLSQSIYNVGTFRKTQEILLGSNYKPVQSIVDRDKITLVDGTYLQEVHDQYTFIIPKLENKAGVGNTLVYDLGIYNIISIDSSRDGLYYITGKYSSVYTPHTYAITLNSNSQTLKETETYTIAPTCTDNGVVVTSPTVIYTSSDTNIATVSSTGVVRCLGVGSATINCNYYNVSVDLTITVEEKPVEPVVSYVENWSQTTTIKQYVTSTYTVTRTTDSVVETPLIDYVFDSAGQALISSSKIVVTRKNDNSFSVKNSTITTTTTCYVNIIDHSSGHVIENQLLTFVKGI